MFEGERRLGFTVTTVKINPNEIVLENIKVLIVIK